MKISIALSNVGGLSNTSKMPCKSYGIPAAACLVGGKLRKIAGSVCHGCYAHKGAYSWPMVKAAYQRRLDSIGSADWVQSMAILVNREKQKVFRWHDSGDLMSLDHFKAIIDVCLLTPSIKHWLPTREKAIINSYSGTMPSNLVVRLSAPMVDGLAPVSRFNTSTVTSAPLHDNQATHDKTFYCDAPANNGECGTCRACWDETIENVNYRKH